MTAPQDERRRGSGAFQVDETSASVPLDLYATLGPGEAVGVAREEAVPGVRYAKVLHHGSIDPFTEDLPLAPPAVCSAEWEGAAGAAPDAALRPNFQRGPRVPSPAHGDGPVPSPNCSCGYRIVKDLDTLAAYVRWTRLGTALLMGPSPEVLFVGVIGYGTVCQRQANGRDPVRTLRVSHLELTGPVIGAPYQRELVEAVTRWFDIEGFLAKEGLPRLRGVEDLVPLGGGR